MKASAFSTLTFCLLLIIGCRENSSGPDDDNLAFEGTYKLEDFQFKYIEDMLFNLFSTFGGTPGIITADSEHARLLVIAGNEFTLDDAKFNITIDNGQARTRFRCMISATGDIMNNKIGMDFQLSFGSSANDSMSGKTTGIRI